MLLAECVWLLGITLANKAGIHVFMEKPFTTSVEETAELVKCSHTFLELPSICLDKGASDERTKDLRNQIKISGHSFASD